MTKKGRTLKKNADISVGAKAAEGNGKNGNGKKYDDTVRKKVDVWKYKKYMCRARLVNIKTGKRVVILNRKEAQEHDIYAGYRTEVRVDGTHGTTIADTTEDPDVVKPGQIGIYQDIAEELGIKENAPVEIIHLDRPKSLEYIHKKLNGISLESSEIDTIVKEIMDEKLSEVEITAWISAAYMGGLTDDEIVSLTYATMNSGESLDLGKHPILDKHCIGGVAGNRTTMIIAPVIAAAGLYIPKTSSRAITSAAGTADTMEVLADVDFSLEELRHVVLKCKGAIVWGGGMKLAPVDDRLIRVRNPLSLDPEGMLLASILGKKKSVGAEYAVIDIPVGPGAKVKDIERANALASHFLKIGKRIGIKLEVLITNGEDPIGVGVGPALEARDVLAVLEGGGPADLRHKSCFMGGTLLELAGKAKKGEGYGIVDRLISNGKALAKFKEMIELQGGDPKVTSKSVPVGQYEYLVQTERAGRISHVDNKAISKICRIAGCPFDHGSGIEILKKKGDYVNKGDPVFRIRAESEAKLSFAIQAIKDLEPVEFQKMLLGTLQ
ncbi:MAG: AMP phosphorylase [Candidatus Bilamarchaeaceae archaeon]